MYILYIANIYKTYTHTWLRNQIDNPGAVTGSIPGGCAIAVESVKVGVERVLERVQ